MADKINLNKYVFRKEDFNKTLDTSFNEFGVSDTVTPQNFPTIEEFFQLYENLFFEIPKVGGNNSHEYLITKSSDYINFEKINDEIQALLNEIAQIRQENLQLNETIFNLQIENSQLQNKVSSSQKPIRSQINNNSRGSQSNI